MIVHNFLLKDPDPADRGHAIRDVTRTHLSAVIFDLSFISEDS
jgi:hypothetical protein